MDMTVVANFSNRPTGPEWCAFITAKSARKTQNPTPLAT